MKTGQNSREPPNEPRHGFRSVAPKLPKTFILKYGLAIRLREALCGYQFLQKFRVIRKHRFEEANQIPAR